MFKLTFEEAEMVVPQNAAPSPRSLLGGHRDAVRRLPKPARGARERGWAFGPTTIRAHRPWSLGAKASILGKMKAEVARYAQTCAPSRTTPLLVALRIGLTSGL